MLESEEKEKILRGFVEDNEKNGKYKHLLDCEVEEKLNLIEKPEKHFKFPKSVNTGNACFQEDIDGLKVVKSFKNIRNVCELIDFLGLPSTAVYSHSCRIMKDQNDDFLRFGLGFFGGMSVNICIRKGYKLGHFMNGEWFCNFRLFIKMLN